MATNVVDWLCKELRKLGMDETEDIARYILSIKEAELDEYMQGLLDTSDPQVRVLLQELRVRSGQDLHGNNNLKVYMKDVSEDKHNKSVKKKKNRGAENSNENRKSPLEPVLNGGFTEMTSVLATGKSSTPSSQGNSATPDTNIGFKKKSKFVPLYSKEGQAKSVIQLPGRHICECQASKHKLINNCINCGRIVCEQEGVGPCVFCGCLVCTPADQEIIDRGSKKGEKLRQYLMKNGGHPAGSSDNSSQPLTSVSLNKPKQGFDQALRHRDKLLEFDRTSARRTQVIDDECDYYSTDSNQWLGKEDQERLRQREEELRSARHGSRRDRKITFDFAGRRVIDADDESGKKMYSIDDEVVQLVHYGRSSDRKVAEDIINPANEFQPLKFDDSISWGPSRNQQAHHSTDNFSPAQLGRLRLQDKELQEISDDGMCLSMHQPWASLLVAGIKMHEGRTWYTAHRGRLWIASTAKPAALEDIRELERMYRHLYKDASLSVPKEYPVGCLLGCVTVEDCLSQEEYRQQYPDGESPSPFVFICTNPQQLIVKFPIKGKHKIYKLEQHTHQAAKKGLR